MNTEIDTGTKYDADTTPSSWAEGALRGTFDTDAYLAAERSVINGMIEHYVRAKPQSWLKRAHKSYRQANLAFKRARTNEMLGIDLVAENANPHGSRAIRRKVSHDARKGTKPAPFGGGSVKLTAADLVERHGCSALHVLSQDVYDKALKELNSVGKRLDLRAKDGFRKTVEALSEVLERRVG